MSRNFELLYQMNKTQEILQTDSEPAVVPLVPVEVTTGAPTLKLDGMAREEISKLVQRLFQMPDKGTRHVVFTSMESGDGCSWICSRVGEILAGQVAGSICIVDCSLRAPSLHRQFKVENHYGFAYSLSGEWPHPAIRAATVSPQSVAVKWRSHQRRFAGVADIGPDARAHRGTAGGVQLCPDGCGVFQRLQSRHDFRWIV